MSKRDNSIRLTIDYRWLNERTVKDAHPLPNIPDLYAQLSQSTYYTKVDCFSGFYQVQMDPDSRQYTAFSCEWGLFEYVVMPMGLTNAPATFQRLMNLVLHDEIRLGYVVVYMDDILIHSSTAVEHILHVITVIEKLRRAGLKIKLSKCEVAKTSVTFLGHVISKGSISPSQVNVQSLYEYARPTTLKQLQSFLGLSGYYRRFIPAYAAIAHPLLQLLQGHDSTVRNTKVMITWNDDAETSFQTLRTFLTTHPLLILPDLHKEFMLDTDACNYAVGAVLSQSNDENKAQPVAYFSKHMTSAQKNYATSEKELLAIVLATEHFAQYLWGSTFIINTDHQPLAWLMKTPKPSARLARWLIRLRDFNFTIQYKTGKTNVNADAMSRWPIEDEVNHNDSEDNEDQLIAIIFVSQNIVNRSDREDEESDQTDKVLSIAVDSEPPQGTKSSTTRLRQLMKQLEQFEDKDVQWIKDLVVQHQQDRPDINSFSNGVRKELFKHYDNYQVIDNVLYHCQTRNGTTTTKYVLPSQLTDYTISQIHSTIYSGHLGTKRSYHKLRNIVFRPGLKQRVAKFVRECDVCQKVKTTPTKTAPLQPLHPSAPNELITTDLAGPLTKTARNNTHMMVIVDHFTKFVDIVAVPDIKATTIADRLVEHMMRYGICEHILSDLGTQLQSQVVELTYDALGVERLKTTAYHPQCDGISERFIATAKKMTACFVNNESNDWDLLVNKLAYAYNTSVHATTQQTPFEMQFGRKPIIPLDLILDIPKPPLLAVEERKYDETVIDEEGEVTYLRDVFEPHSEKVPEEARQYVRQLKTQLKKAYDIAAMNRDYAMNQAKIIHDRKAYPDHFSVDDLVLVAHPAILSGHSRGLARRYHGPFTIIKRIGPVNYLLTQTSLPDAKRMIIHQNNLKKYFGRETRDSDEPIRLKLEPRRRGYTRRINTAPPNQLSATLGRTITANSEVTTLTAIDPVPTTPLITTSPINNTQPSRDHNQVLEDENTTQRAEEAQQVVTTKGKRGRPRKAQAEQQVIQPQQRAIIAVTPPQPSRRSIRIASRTSNSK